MGKRVTVKTPKELGKALKGKADEILIEGDLKKKVIRIRVTGKVAWLVAIGAIAAAVAAIIASGGLALVPGGALAAPAIWGSGAALAAPAVGILGFPTTVVAISIAIAAGGVGALNKLRKYKVVERGEDQLVLRRK